MDEDCALKRARAYLKFREHKKDVYKNLTIDNDVMDEMNGGGCKVLDGETCDGRKVALVVNSMMHWHRTLFEVLQMQVYNHENLMRDQVAQEKGIIIVQDMGSFSLSQIWRVSDTSGLSVLLPYPRSKSHAQRGFLTTVFPGRKVWGASANKYLSAKDRQGELENSSRSPFFCLSEISLSSTSSFQSSTPFQIVIVGEPRMFSKAWNVIKLILPKELRETVVMLGSDWASLPEAVAGPNCQGPVSEAMKEHAKKRAGLPRAEENEYSARQGSPPKTNQNAEAEL